MNEPSEPSQRAEPATAKPGEGAASVSGALSEAKPCHLAKALAMAGELARRLSGERGQTQLAIQIVELEAQLRLAWEDRIDLSLKVLELGALNLKLKQQARLGREVIYDDGLYWLGGSGRNKIDGPLCPTCWEVEDKLVHLSRVSVEVGRVAEPGQWRQWECPRCNEVFLRKEGLATAAELGAQSGDAPAER